MVTSVFSSTSVILNGICIFVCHAEDGGMDGTGISMEIWFGEKINLVVEEPEVNIP